MTKIFFDSDGVMANLDSAIVIHTQQHYWHTRRISKEHWAILEQVPNLFYNLDVMPGAYEMFHAVYKAHPDKVEVLTALPEPTGKLHTSEDDKVRWFRQYIHPTVPVNTVLGGKNKYKWLTDHPGAILIDDYDRNIEQWVANGGVGILHTDPHSTIEKLKVLGVL